jgi:hypothetical protein
MLNVENEWLPLPGEVSVGPCRLSRRRVRWTPVRWPCLAKYTAVLAYTVLPNFSPDLPVLSSIRPTCCKGRAAEAWKGIYYVLSSSKSIPIDNTADYQTKQIVDNRSHIENLRIKSVQSPLYDLLLRCSFNRFNWSANNNMDTAISIKRWQF